VPGKPGNKDFTLTVVTDCGTFSRTVRYKVDLCNVQAAPIAVDKTSVYRGETFNASVDLEPGHTVRWTVVNGTLSATEGASVQVTATGTSGTVRVSAFVTRGDSNSAVCEVRSTATVAIQQCAISNLNLFTSPGTAFLPINYPVDLTLVGLAPHESATFTTENAQILASGPDTLRVRTPASGSFRVFVHVSTGTCTRTISWSFMVADCQPKAVVSGGDSCEMSSVTATFTGTAPFFGHWNDGTYFNTMESQIVRVVDAPGTYTIAEFTDSGFCPGEVSGSVDVTSLGLPQPAYEIDGFADNGGYYDSRTCPGLGRTARLTVPIPAGVTVTWSIENGTITAGQGTAEVKFYGNAPGRTNLTATFTNAQGCTSQYTFPYFVTLGVPEASVSVEPATIEAGGTAVVEITRLNEFVTGWNLTSSLGDILFPIGQVDEFTFAYEYRSTHGGGVATISLDMLNECGNTNTATATLTINVGDPVQGTATVHQAGTDCTNFYVYADLTGTAPFIGTWSNGQTFYSDYPWIYLYPEGPGTYTITEFNDANGPGTVSGSATFDYVSLPAPEFVLNSQQACPNATITATLTTPLPEGALANWDIQGGTILSGQGTDSVVIQAGESFLNASVQLTGAGACSANSPWQSVNVSSYVQQPQFYLSSVYAGQSTDFGVWVDPYAASVSWEAFNGDAITLVSNPWPGYYVLRYTSAHGTGESTVRIFGTTQCGSEFEATRVVQILAAPPTATLTQASAACGTTITVHFTGTAPFTAAWSDTGETFTTSESTYSRAYTAPYANWVSLYNFSDATGQFGYADSLYAQPGAQVPYPAAYASGEMCPGSTSTATVYDVPEGYSVQWTLDGTAGRIVSGANEPTVTVEALEIGSFDLRVRLVSPEGCLGPQITFQHNVNGPLAGNPVITVPQTTLAPGESIELTIEFPFSYLYNGISWQPRRGCSSTSTARRRTSSPCATPRRPSPAP